MKLSLQTREMFFDRDKVLASMESARRRALSKAGMIVRRSAIKAIREQSPGRPSRPGDPPRSAIGRLQSAIFYSYDPSTQSVVVGPELLAARRNPGGIPATETLEHGGIAQRRRGRPFRMEARPYMAPALAKHIDKVAPLWRDTVKATTG